MRSSSALCGCNGACIAIMIFVVVHIVLLLRWSPSSAKASTLKAPPRESSSGKASSREASSIEAVAVVEGSSSTKVAVEVPASAVSVLRVVWTILPKMSSMVGPTRLTTFSFLSFLFEVLHFLCFNFGLFFVIVFSVSHLFLLLHEVLDLFLRCEFRIISIESELQSPGLGEAVE